MANKFWVNGSGLWSDATNHWATSTGGSPGAGNLPTSNDNVFFDENSGLTGATITMDVNGECNDFTSQTGINYVIDMTLKECHVYGSLMLESGLHDIETNDQLSFVMLATTVGKTITPGGCVLAYLKFDGIGGEWTLQDDLSASIEIDFYNGTLDTNDKNITSGYCYFAAYYQHTPTVIMGSGIWDVGGWEIFEDRETVIITPETSTIKLVGNSPYFYGGGKTYHDLWITVTDTYVYGSNGFHNLKIDPGLAVYFEAGSTQTINGIFDVVGTAGNLITLDSDDSPNQFILSKLSGTVACDYLDLSNSNATGGATWYAGSHSVNNGNNTGWIFTDPPASSPNSLFFGQNF